MRRLIVIVLLAGAAGLVLWRREPGREERVEVAREWAVMGTFLSVRAFAADSARAQTAAAEARHAVFRVDSLMSTWKPESEISQLNARAGSGEWTGLSRETQAVLRASQTLSQASGGAFDVTVGPLMRAWGFRGGVQRPPPAGVLDSARALVGHRLLELDSVAGKARLTRAGAAVDLGAIAKGYALDLGAAAMKRAGAVAGTLDLGGNVLVFGAPPRGRKEWVVGILDPRDPQATIGEIRLRAGSVATSGDYEQFFEVNGVRYSHIMDARTGSPARGILQTTVAASTGLQSDGLSTTLFVLGPEAGRALLSQAFARGATVIWVRDSLPLDAGDVIVAGSAAERVRIAVPAR